MCLCVFRQIIWGVCVNRKSVHSAGDWRGSNPREHHPTTEGGVCCQRGECVWPQSEDTRYTHTHTSFLTMLIWRLIWSAVRSDSSVCTWMKNVFRKKWAGSEVVKPRCFTKWASIWRQRLDPDRPAPSELLLLSKTVSWLKYWHFCIFWLLFLASALYWLQSVWSLTFFLT